MEPKFSLSLTQKEWDTVLGALADKPFKDVHQIIGSLIEQFKQASQPKIEPVITE
jgi:hypothetical protein